MKPNHRIPSGWEELRVSRVSSIHWGRCFWDRKLHGETTEESVTNGSVVEDTPGTQGKPAATLMAAAFPLLWLVRSCLCPSSPAPNYNF